MANFILCPKTGLSYTVEDSFKATGIQSNIYTISIDEDKLIEQVRKFPQKCSNEYIAAACLLYLQQNDLIIGQEKETKYTRGHAVTFLADNYSKFLLIRLWRIIKNTQAMRRLNPIKLNLVTILNTPNLLYSQLETIGAQELIKEDYDYFRERRLARRNKIKRKKERKVLSTTLDQVNGKLDPLSVRCRIEKTTRILVKHLLAENKHCLDAPKDSYIKASKMLADYLYLRPQARSRVIELYKELLDKSLGYQIIPRDKLIHKSIQIMIRLLESEVKIVDELIEF